MQRIALRLRRVYAAEERHVLLVAVVDGAGGVTVPPPALLGRRQPLDQAGHLGPGHAVRRQFGEGGEPVPVGLELAVELGHRIGHAGPPSGAVPASRAGFASGAPSASGAVPGCAMVPALRAGSLVASASPARPASARAPRDRYG